MKFNVPKVKRRPTDEALIQQRLVRTIRLLGLLKSGPIYNSRRLADELSVSRRTIYRDLRALREAGVAVLMDKWSEAYYVRQREPGQIPLSHDQAVLLALAAHLSALNCNSEFTTQLRAATASLVGALPQSLQLAVGRLLSHTHVKTYGLPTQVMNELLRALRHQQAIRVLIEAERGVYVNLVVLPSHLVASGDGWQLFGNVAGDVNMRTFNVASFLRVEAIESKPSSTAVDQGASSETPSASSKGIQRMGALPHRLKMKAFACAG